MKKNRINKEYILKNYEYADSAFKRAMGIMFRKQIDRPMLFIFPTRGRTSIHSFFCPKFDAVFLDYNRRVIDSYERIGPGQIIIPRERVNYLIEFPPGTISKERIRKGVVIKFKR